MVAMRLLDDFGRNFRCLCGEVEEKADAAVWGRVVASPIAVVIAVVIAAVAPFDLASPLSMHL